jgi:hypothetical protein
MKIGSNLNFKLKNDENRFATVNRSVRYYPFIGTGGVTGWSLGVLQVHHLGTAHSAAVPGRRVIGAPHDDRARARRRARRPRGGLEGAGALAERVRDPAVVPGDEKGEAREGGAWEEGEEGEGTAGHGAGGERVKLLETLLSR